MRHLDAAAIARDPLVLELFVLAAVALEVFRRAEDALAEEPVFFRLERTVVDRLGLFHLAPRPAPDHLRRGNANGDRVKDVHLVKHDRLLSAAHRFFALTALTVSGSFSSLPRSDGIADCSSSRLTSRSNSSAPVTMCSLRSSRTSSTSPWSSLTKTLNDSGTEGASA